VLFSLDAMEKVSEKVKRGFRVLRSFMTGLKATAKLGGIELELGVNPETGTADSGPPPWPRTPPRSAPPL